MPKVNKARYAILGMLALEPSSGYDIKKKMAATTDHFWKESDGALYPTLRQLNEEGLVSYKIENPESGKPKKIYRITESGKHEFSEWMQQSVNMAPVRHELLLKMFFGGLVDKSVMIKHLRAFRDTVKKKLETYESYQKEIKKEKANNIYNYLTIRAGVMNTENFIRWCDEALDLLENN
jgi:PadR family transcriptional regulator, regulatory protein AphA